MKRRRPGTGATRRRRYRSWAPPSDGRRPWPARGKPPGQPAPPNSLTLHHTRRPHRMRSQPSVMGQSSGERGGAVVRFWLALLLSWTIFTEVGALLGAAVAYIPALIAYGIVPRDPNIGPSWLL